MIKYIVILSFILCSCVHDVFHVVEIEEKYERYYYEFIYQAHVRGIDLDYNYLSIKTDGDMSSTGNAKTLPRKTYYITIDKAFIEFNEKDTMLVEKVVFHELGHALLGKDHVDYNSIMKQGRIVYNPDNRKEMIDELFE